MTTKALPLKNRPYMFATNPTASAPTAAEMSLWLRKRVPVKWLDAHPMQEVAMRRYFGGAERVGLRLSRTSVSTYQFSPIPRGVEPQAQEKRVHRN